MSDSHTHSTFLAPEISLLEPLFPGYEIESLIATGGMGAVYCAVQKSLDRTVAIKILPQEFSKDASFCAGFEAEAKAMARLNHPNLIGVYDFGEVQGMLYIIMEYVPGKSLFDSANGIAIDPGEVIRLVSGICHGLAHAHENGIVHRDIKPSNILLDLNAQPKIGDFGLARPVERKDQEGDQIFGTPHYTAPEVLDSPESVGFRADIFSVGVVLHELLTGFLPAQDPRPVSVIRKCDPRFDAVIQRATNPNPELRYASATEMANDLHAITVPAAARAARAARVTRKAGPVPKVRPRPMARPITAQPSSSTSSVIVWLLLILAAAIVVLAVLLNRQKNEQPLNEKLGKELLKLREKAPSDPRSSKNPSEFDKDSTPFPEREPETRPKPRHRPENRPGPRPELEIRPEPIPKFELAPTGDRKSGVRNETTPQTTPETTPPVASVPAFDVNGFLVNARKIVEPRTKKITETRDKNLAKNLGGMRRGVKRLILKMPQMKDQRIADNELDRLIEECQKNQNRIPSGLDENFHKLEKVDDTCGEFLEKQKEIDSEMLSEITKLGDVYTAELKKKISQLKLVKDLSSIKLIEEEVARVSQEAEYFPKLVLGEDLAGTRPLPEE